MKQLALLNGITLGPRQTDSVNGMIPLTDTHTHALCLTDCTKAKQALDALEILISLTKWSH
jgi:hypothetical protein